MGLEAFEVRRDWSHILGEKHAVYVAFFRLNLKSSTILTSSLNNNLRIYHLEIEPENKAARPEVGCLRACSFSRLGCYWRYVVNRKISGVRSCKPDSPDEFPILRPTCKLLKSKCWQDRIERQLRQCRQHRNNLGLSLGTVLPRPSPRTGLPKECFRLGYLLSPVQAPGKKLLVSQRRHGIHACGPACWNVARQESHQHQENRDRYERHRIGRRNAVDHRGDDPRRRTCRTHAE